MENAKTAHLKDPKVEGVFTALSLISLIQCISNNKKMCIKLYSMDGSEGHLHFDNARVVGADINNLQHGVKAFFRMMEWENARFQAFEVSKIEKEKYRINEDVSSLLIEGLRQNGEKDKIKKQLHPFYKIVPNYDNCRELSHQEIKLMSMIPDNGIFTNVLVDRVDMTDWEAYSTIQSLIIKKALVLTKIKALVVDDSELIASIVRDILEHQFDGIMAVRVVRNGGEAIRLIESGSLQEHPDLVFTDIVMDGLNGIDVINAARNCDPPIHVIAITSLQREMKDILNLGANYLHKFWLTRDNVGKVIMNLVEKTLNGETQVIGGEKDMLYERAINA